MTLYHFVPISNKMNNLVADLKANGRQESIYKALFHHIPNTYLSVGYIGKKAPLISMYFSQHCSPSM